MKSKQKERVKDKKREKQHNNKNFKERKRN